MVTKTAETTRVLSDHVKILAETERVLSDRVKRLKDRFMDSRPRLSVERAHCLLEVYKETEGQAEIIKRAKVFERYFSTVEIEIDENLIVGGLAKDVRGFPVHPEHSCEWMLDQKESLTSHGFGKEAIITKEDWEVVERLVDYWHDKCAEFRTNKVWSERTGLRYDDLIEAGLTASVADNAKGKLSVNYGKVLEKGLNGVIREAEEQLANLPVSTIEDLRKRDFLKAAIISCNAVITLARRYADLARDMARKETDHKRRAELERIAHTCEWVPAEPARSFYEAIQSVFLIHIGVWLDKAGGSGISPGRFPMYMYPFYKRDKDAGRITDEEVIELFELFFLKCSSLATWESSGTHEWLSQSSFQNVNIGGLTSDGQDATNELDYLLIEAQKRVRLPQPTLSLLYHNKLPEDFLLKAADCVRTGMGMPAFFNAIMNVQRLLDQGASVSDAREGGIIGCVEGFFSNSGDYRTGGFMNAPKMLEFALNNGKDPLTGKQLGAKTGKGETLKSYEELYEAVRKQFSRAMYLIFEHDGATMAIDAEYFPTPFTSALTDDCIKNGKDCHCGGARYSMDGMTAAGMVDLADSLAAIKKLVFDEKAITMKELQEALQADFEGYEVIRQSLLQAPKYGNDDDYVDSILRELYTLFEEEHHQYKSHYGTRLRPSSVSVTNHVKLGRRTGALPSGRKAKTPFADATLSPSPGMDKQGPTAIIRSATKVIDNVKYVCSQLNMKFHPSALEGKEGLKKLLALVKTYMDLGGHHVQFNVVSADTLRDAKLHPENYRDLLVRVVGFSAFFIHLDPGIQEEIIARTELKL